MHVKRFKISAVYKQQHLKKTLVYQGLWGLKATSHGIITTCQLESARNVITRLTDKMCKVWVKVTCDFFLSKKPIGSRMGKGVGSFFKFILNVPKGMLLLEVFPNVLVREKLLRKSLIIASKKFSLGVKLSKKNVIFIQ